ncbi:MAG: C-terminal target protein, partial [Pedosphaera sp.]|nr:C-terminal target protein [Pedosphaera sp.]
VVNVPPGIAIPPQSLAVAQGSNATFNVTATGTAPLTYQWQFNSGNIAGATNTSYTRTNLQSTDAGNYQVVITNIAGSVTSAPATLAISAAPLITIQPQSLTLTQGTAAVFSVVVSGTAPLSYQWRYNGGNIASATNTTYTRTNVQTVDAGNYSVVVTNIAGIVTSSNAALVVNVPPGIAIPPQSLAVSQGSNATFNVTATGTAPLTYQWQFNNGNIAGATNTSYTRTNLQSADAGNYQVVVTNIAGSVTSPPATLTVNVPPLIGVQPQSLVLTQGMAAVFSVVVSGTAPLSYQWRLNGSVIASATNTSYTRTNVQTADAGNYSVVVTNIAGIVTSSNAALVVNVPPGIAIPPQSLAVAQGSNATFTVTATGTAPLGYQWQFNNTNIVGASATNYTCTNVQSANVGSYRVVVTNMVGSVTSLVANLTFGPAPSIVTQPQSVTLPQAAMASFGVVASGAAPLSYQWRYNGVNINSATNSSYNRTNVQPADAGNYSVIITDLAGAVVSSNAVLAVTVPPVIVTQPQSVVISQNSSATFTVTATGVAPLSYQWQFNGAAIAGAINSSFTRASAQPAVAGLYRVVVMNASGSVTSQNANLAVTTKSLLAAIPNKVINEGTALTIPTIVANPDIIANRLTFSLGANAPTGTTIDTNTGVFTWTPSEAQGPSTNKIMVLANDKYIPTYNDAVIFNVVVNEVNQAPVLAVITNYTIHARSLLNIAASATDPDLPANILTFSLDPGAPTGAIINPTNGILAWTPTDTQLGAKQFTVRVTDNGSPSLSNAKSFSVNVITEPVIQSIDLSGGGVTLTWSTIPGQVYRVEYESNFSSGSWMPLSGDVTATNTTATKSDTSSMDTGRLYRIILVP